MSSVSARGSTNTGSPQGKDKDNKKKQASARPAGGPTEGYAQFISTFVIKHLRMIVQVFFATVAVIIAYVLYRNLFTGVRDLRNADVDSLKQLLLGEDPAVFYCHRGGKAEVVPPVYLELHKQLGSQMTFALLNCSQMLPSGKTMWDRFHLKKDMRPTLFVTSPWSRSKQIPPSNLKDVATLKKYVMNAVSARAAEVSTMKEFSKRCSSAAASDSDTCITILKGTKYTSAHLNIEENLVKQYPKAKVVSIDAVKHRLSFEDTQKHAAENFSIKLHAVRKGGYYLSMHDPPNWENVEAFVTRAISSKLDQYDGYGDIQLVAAPAKGFKKRTSTMPPSSTTRPTTADSTDTHTQQTAAKTEAKEPNGQSESELEAARLARERRRREEMERQQREALFEDGDEDDNVEAETHDREHYEDEHNEDESEDKDEDELIEL